ncbi:MAG: DUF924 family protein [Reyranellaceae bacterium]
MAETRAGAILEFWFGTADPQQEVEYRDSWFERSAEFDARIRDRFAADVELALGGALDGMAADAGGVLALLLLLDQFPRNLFRGTARAFAGDERARRIAAAAIARGDEAAMSPRHRIFLYLPFEHSEALADQERSVVLFAALGDRRGFDYAVRHRDIVARFGRFPHRNAALGRQSTPEEIEFLQTPGSSF